MTFPRSGAQPHEPLPDDADWVQDDLDQAELVQSSSLQNTWATAGPSALPLVPLAALLAWANRRVRALVHR